MTPAELRKEIRAIGDEFSMDVVMKCLSLYRPLHDAAPKVPVKIARDEKYGSDERNQARRVSFGSRIGKRPPRAHLHAWRRLCRR